MTQPKPRPTIAEMVRYQPNLGAPVTDRVIRLSANEGAFGPSPKALVAMEKQSNLLHWYPEEEPLELAEKIASKYDLNPENMVFGCGSDELIMAICQAYLDPGAVSYTHLTLPTIYSV